MKVGTVRARIEPCMVLRFAAKCISDRTNGADSFVIAIGSGEVESDSIITREKPSLFIPAQTTV